MAMYLYQAFQKKKDNICYKLSPLSLALSKVSLKEKKYFHVVHWSLTVHEGVGVKFQLKLMIFLFLLSISFQSLKTAFP